MIFKTNSGFRKVGMTNIVNCSDIKPNMILRGPIFPEPIQVIIVTPMGDAIRLIGKGLTTGKLHDPILSAEQLATLEITPEDEPVDGDAGNFRLGVEAMRLALAYESSRAGTARAWRKMPG
jgi:hypothetical protein